MRTLDALTSVPIVLAFLAGASIVSEGTEVASTDAVSAGHTASVFPLVAVGLLFALLISGLILVARETGHEDREKRNRDKT